MKNFWKEARDYILIIISVLIIRTFIVTPAIVDGASMDHTLEDGQLVFNSTSYTDYNWTQIINQAFQK